jgi:hypothetical protein
MPAEQDSASVIEDILNTIADDDVGSFAAGPLRRAWNGQRFDEGVLREAFVSLAEEPSA